MIRVFINNSCHGIFCIFLNLKIDPFVCIFLEGQDSEGGFPGFERRNVFISICVSGAGVLVLVLDPSRDLCHVGTGKNHGDQLDQGQHQPHRHVDRQDGGYLVLEKLLKDEHASVLVDGGGDALGLFQPVRPASLAELLAAGVGHGVGELVLERICVGIVVVSMVGRLASTAASELGLDSVPLGLDPLIAFLAVVSDLLGALASGGGGGDLKLELHGVVDRSNLEKEGDAEHDGHYDQGDTILVVGDEEAEEAGEEGDDAEGEHEHGSDGEDFVPEVEVMDVVVVNEEESDADEDDGADREEGVGEIDEALVLGGSSAPSPQTHPTRSANKSHFVVVLLFVSFCKSCRTDHKMTVVVSRSGWETVMAGRACCTGRGDNKTCPVGTRYLLPVACRKCW